MVEQLDISVEGALGVIALNRPEAINALSLGMIEGIIAQLMAWQADPKIRAVLFEGRGTKGFCAGGDVRAARTLVLEGRQAEANAYFATEYRMNGLIAGYGKPVIAIGSGIVMGGGIGIAGHCGFRITVPGARFAMPEAAIGFFGDVGVNAILARAPVNRALLFLMSGASVGAADALALGLADSAVAPERIDDLRANLPMAASAPSPATAIVGLMQADAIIAGDTPFCQMADLLPADTPDTPEDFLDDVADVPELAELRALLATRSPTALTAIFYSQMAARRMTGVDAVLEMDARLASAVSALPDFAEGVRAVLVDKDQKPRWTPATLDEVDEGPILAAIGIA